MQFDLEVSLMFALGLAFSAVLAAGLLQTIRIPGPATEDRRDRLVFLLQDGLVVDCNFKARRMLDVTTGPISDMEKLRLCLSRDFEDVDRILSDAGGHGDILAMSRDGRSRIARVVTGTVVQLTLRSLDETTPPIDDVHAIHAMQNELALLRANTSAAPFLLWRQNTAGEVTWVNQTYLETLQNKIGADLELTWPLPALFPGLQVPAEATRTEAQRLAINGRAAGDEAWYDCHVTPVGNDHLCTAVPADEAVRADNRRREFTQTLTKTFAELAIGLAIFDRSRRLVLFNPALLDLTGLPTDFLSSRPSMIAFLDRLRENRVMPEPRDYRAWRSAIAELEAAAADGTYSETWPLPDGQTYHVTGRPHPDGAVALLFEDISAEMSLTRRFRADLEQYQSVLDSVSDAVALFSAAGQLVLANDGYRELWQTDPDATPGPVDVTEATRQWHNLTVPTPVWGDFRDFARIPQDREEWTAQVQLLDGRRLHCRFLPHKAGATMAVFSPQMADLRSDLELRQTG